MKKEKQVHSRGRRLGGIRVSLQKIQHPGRGVAQRNTEEMKLPKKIIEEHFLEVKDELQVS